MSFAAPDFEDRLLPPPKEILTDVTTRAGADLQRARSLLSEVEPVATGVRVRHLLEARSVLGQVHSLIPEGQSALRRLNRQWLHRVTGDLDERGDTRENFTTQAFGLRFQTAEEASARLEAIEREAQDRINALASSRLSRLVHKKEIQDIRRQLAQLEGYSSDYRENVLPFREGFDRIRDGSVEADIALTTSVRAVAGRTIIDSRERQEGVEQRRGPVLSDEAWHHRANGQMIAELLNPRLEREVAEGKFTSETADAIRAFAAACLVSGFRYEYTTGHPQYGATEAEIEDIRIKYAQYQALQTASRHEAEYILRTVGLSGNVPDPNSRYVQVGEVITDLAVYRPVDYIDDLVELVEGDWELSRGLFQISDSVRSKIGVQRLLDIQGAERWVVVSRRLVDQGVITQADVTGAEKALSWTLVDQAIIPGRRESDDGTKAGYILGQVGSPHSLEPMLLYQGLVAAPTGLYSAGHTNNAVQGNIEKIIRSLSEGDIASMDAPQFVKNVILAFKKPQESDLVSTEAKEVWDQMDGYSRARYVSEMFGREFRVILDELKTNPKVRRDWLSVALRGISAVIGDLEPSDYTFLADMAILSNNEHEKTEIIRALAGRVKGISSFMAHHEQNDAGLAAESLVTVISHPGYKPETEHLISLFRVCENLAGKFDDPAFALPVRNQSRQIAEQIADKMAEWIQAPALPVPAVLPSVVPAAAAPWDPFAFEAEPANAGGQAVQTVESGALNEIQLMLALQSFDVLGMEKYAQIVKDKADALIQLPGLEEKYPERGNGRYGMFGDKMIFAKETNSHGVYHMLADMLVRAEITAPGIPNIRTSLGVFSTNSDASEGILETYKSSRLNEQLDARPEAKREFVSSLLSHFDEIPPAIALSDFAELERGLVEAFTWRLGFMKDQTTVDLAREKISGFFVSDRLMGAVAVFCYDSQRDPQNEFAKEARTAFAESAQSTIVMPSSSKIAFFAAVVLGSADWESPEIYQTIASLDSQNPDGQSLNFDEFMPGGNRIFSELKEKYQETNLSIKQLRKFLGVDQQASQETPDLDSLREEALKLYHRDQRGSNLPDLGLIEQLIVSPGNFPRALKAAETHGLGVEVFQLLTSTYAGAMVEVLADPDSFGPFAETARNILTAEESSDWARSAQENLVRGVVGKLKEAIRAQTIRPEQTGPIVDIIKSNPNLYSRVIRSL